MKNFRQRLALAAAPFLLGLAFSQPAQAAGPLAFTPETLQQLEERYAGRPFLLVLWSIHCAPCFAELAMLGELLEEYPGLPLALVSTDPPETAADVRFALEDQGLEDYPSWQFAGDFPERLRYAIDPDWFGELPRSYFYDAAHARRGHSGTLEREMVLEWISRNPASE